MKKRMIFVTVLALISTLLLGACDAGGTESQPPAAAQPTATPEPTAAEIDLEEAAVIFVGSCSACHAEDGTGVENLGKDLTSSEFVSQSSDAELIEFIKVGRSVDDPLNSTGIDMPAKGGNPALSDDDILAIVAFLRSIQQ